jgi:hypothetical protein
LSRANATRPEAGRPCQESHKGFERRVLNGASFFDEA